jgi:hypothetical protein
VAPSKGAATGGKPVSQPVTNKAAGKAAATGPLPVSQTVTNISKTNCQNQAGLGPLRIASYFLSLF